MAALALSYLLARCRQVGHCWVNGHRPVTRKAMGRVYELACRECRMVFWQRGQLRRKAGER
jgi:hypothetical protein